MFADWSVEMSSVAEEPIVVIPWQGGESGTKFEDLRQSPEAIALVPEASQHPALGAALVHWNAAEAPWSTIKCDAFVMEPERLQSLCLEMDYEPEDFSHGFSSYVDIALLQPEQFISFSLHEQLMYTMVAAVAKLQQTDGAAEFVLRRCFRLEEECDGFCISIYTHGLAASEAQAYARWADALTALLQPLPRAAWSVLPPAS